MANEDDGGDDDDEELDEYASYTSVHHTTNGYIPGTPMTRTPATKSDDQPPSCWRRSYTHAQTYYLRSLETYLPCLSHVLGIENKPLGSRCGQPIQRSFLRFLRMADRSRNPEKKLLVENENVRKKWTSKSHLTYF
jgi:hypothetical protein